MSWVPSHKIYQTNGTTLVYNIGQVIRREPAMNLAVPDYIEHENLRGSGSIIIPGGSKAYDMTLYARLGASNYTNLMTALSTLESTIAINTRYILKIDLSSTTTQDLNVMRIQPIVVDNSRGKLHTFLYYTLTLRINCW
jgi:hypothetical protein